MQEWIGIQYRDTDGPGKIITLGLKASRYTLIAEWPGYKAANVAVTGVQTAPKSRC